MLGFPFSNPQSHPPAWITTSFPTVNPATGIRPNMAVVSVDEPIYGGIDSESMQICSECDEDEATQICPAYRCLGNQGSDHRWYTHVQNRCCHITCKKPLCGVRLLPNSRDSHDTRLRFCGECIQGRARCTVCGTQGGDAYYNTNKETNGKGPTE